jgi:ubiquinone/menaquinone biosynthesis C-methylase UbiE
VHGRNPFDVRHHRGAFCGKPPARRVSSIREFEHAGWQAAAATFDGFAGATTLFVEPLLQTAGVKSGMRLLDAACGPGVASAQAAAMGASVTGVDFSSEMIAEARRRHRTIAFEAGDAEALPFPDASFDAVVANFGIHHVERPERAIAEARRTLAPGGTFAFTIWAAWQDNPPWRLVTEAVAAHGRMDVPMPAGSDVRVTPEHFARLTEQAGFAAASIRTESVEKIWRLPRDADLVSIFETGTVRMATLLRGQGAALSAIRRHVAEALQAYRRGETVELPTRAWLIAAKA